MGLARISVKRGYLSYPSSPPPCHHVIICHILADPLPSPSSDDVIYAPHTPDLLWCRGFVQEPASPSACPYRRSIFIIEGNETGKGVFNDFVTWPLPHLFYFLNNFVTSPWAAASHPMYCLLIVGGRPCASSRQRDCNVIMDNMIMKFIIWIFSSSNLTLSPFLSNGHHLHDYI